jgi:hypothetical protein
MADIDVVPRRRSNTWLWIVLAIIVVAVVMMMMMGGDNNATGNSGLLTPDSLNGVIAQLTRA